MLIEDRENLRLLQFLALRGSKGASCWEHDWLTCCILGRRDTLRGRRRHLIFENAFDHLVLLLHLESGYLRLITSAR